MKKLGIFLLSTLIGLTIAEVILRKFEPYLHPPRDDRPRYLYAPELFDHYRMEKLDRDKGQDVIRIAFLGDSITYGEDVQFDDIYPVRLQRLLRLIPGVRFEVLNFALPGASTVQEWKQFQIALTYNPDIVLLGYFLNDPDTHPFNAPWFRKHTFSRTTKWFYHHLAIYRIILHSYLARKFARLNDEYIHNLHFERKKEYDMHLRILNAMYTKATARRIRFGLIIWPALWHPMNRRYPFLKEHKNLRAFFKSRNIPFIDLLDTFMGMDENRLQAVPGLDAHPSEIAHLIAAERVLVWLTTELEWLPPIPPHLIKPNLAFRRQKEWYEKNFPE